MPRRAISTTHRNVRRAGILRKPPVAVTPTGGPPGGDVFFGLNSNYEIAKGVGSPAQLAGRGNTSITTQAVLDAAAAGGVDYLRCQCEWSLMSGLYDGTPISENSTNRVDNNGSTEALRTKFGGSYLTDLDYFVQQAAKRGIRTQFCLNRSPQWAAEYPTTGSPWHMTMTGPSKAGTGTRGNLPYWDIFVQKCVQRWGPNGTFWSTAGNTVADGVEYLPVQEWEVWNEQDGSFSWGAAAGTTDATWQLQTNEHYAQYSTLFKSTWDVIKALDENAMVFVGGLSNGVSAPSMTNYVNWMSAKMRELYPGLSPDAWAVHVYGGSSTGGSTGAVMAGRSKAQVREFGTAVETNWGDGTPIIINEFGASARPGDPALSTWDNPGFAPLATGQMNEWADAIGLVMNEAYRTQFNIIRCAPHVLVHNESLTPNGAGKILRENHMGIFPRDGVTARAPASRYSTEAALRRSVSVPTAQVIW